MQFLATMVYLLRLGLVIFFYNVKCTWSFFRKHALYMFLIINIMTNLISWVLIRKDALKWSNFSPFSGRVPVGRYRRTTWFVCRNLVYNTGRVPWSAIAPCLAKKEDNAQPSNVFRCKGMIILRRWFIMSVFSVLDWN